MTRIKICGITSEKDALLAVHAGADAVGLIFYPPSPRSVTVEIAERIARVLPPFVIPVGVFVNENVSFIEEVRNLCGLQAVQLSGEEPPEILTRLTPPVIRAVRVQDRLDEDCLANLSASAILLDAYAPGIRGGTGKTFDWQLAKRIAKRKTVILAGGLNPGNVAEAVRTVRPYAVDTASGVEAEPGRKDPEKVRAFIRAVREADEIR